MAIFDFFFRSDRRSLNNPRTPLSAPAEWLVEALGGRKTVTGASVTPENSLEVSAVWAAVRLISSTVATLPLPVYREDSAGKHRAPEHPVHNLLKHRPNPEQSAFIFREMLVAHLLLWGNAYAEIERNGRGEAVALWPLMPTAIRLARVGDERIYLVQVDGQEVPLRAETVLHFQGFGVDGQAGLIPTIVARETIGLAKATETYAAQFFGNGAVPLTAITVSGNLTPEQQKSIRDGFNKEHRGLTNVQRLAVLSGGMELKTLGIAPEQSQFLETRKFSVSEIARVFGVPPHLIGDLERATFSNIEAQGIEFVRYCIEPLTRRIEGELNVKFFADGHYAEHVLEGLLRGDSAARAAFYREMTNIGAMTINEVRRLEGLNSIEGGDIPRVPLNMAPLGAEQEAA